MELENLMKEPEVKQARARPSNTPQENLTLRPNIPDSLLDEAQEEDVQMRMFREGFKISEVHRNFPQSQTLQYHWEI